MVLERLEIEKTNDTPFVLLEPGRIQLYGRSMPENVLIFFDPITEWMKKYCENPATFTEIDLYLVYANSCSIKIISDLLRMLDGKFRQGFDMKISWTYEQNDESAKETGYELETMLKIPFKYNEIETETKSKKRILVKNLLTGKTGEISQMYWETIKGNGHDKDFQILES